jgi:hypothetical protein
MDESLSPGVVATGIAAGGALAAVGLLTSLAVVTGVAVWHFRKCADEGGPIPWHCGAWTTDGDWPKLKSDGSFGPDPRGRVPTPSHNEMAPSAPWW